MSCGRVFLPCLCGGVREFAGNCEKVKEDEIREVRYRIFGISHCPACGKRESIKLVEFFSKELPNEK